MNLSGTSQIHFGGQAKLFDSGRRQEKAALASAKADFPSLPEVENLLLAAQKQLLATLCHRGILRAGGFIFNPEIIFEHEKNENTQN